jgi:predicted nucleotide-binding protein
VSNRGDYQGAVERLHDLLVQRSRGGAADDAEYRDLREYAIETQDLAQYAPKWLRRMRTLDIWWANIQPMYRTYAERQRYVSNEFEPLFEHIESLPRDSALSPPKAPQPKPNAAIPRQTPQEVQKANDEMMAFLNKMTGTARTDQHARSRLHPITSGLEHRPAMTPTPAAASASPQSAKAADKTRVFIVHGHDTNRREAVARFVERLGFEAVILADQPDQGRTIIEKFEAHTDVDYAIVVMTPDDMGGAKGGRAQARPRQNVVFEHGFFIGLLGRRKVAALVVGDIEKPSDLSGVLYISWDDAGAWHTRLARERKAVGLPVDMNRV